MKCVMIAGMLTLAAGSIAWAQTAEQRGRAIASEADRRATGYGDVSASLLMILRDGRGAERTRELTVAAVEIDEAEERVIIRFESPRDLRGTALLTVNRRSGSRDQWLYLPALQRTKRIAGAKRSGSFMGSEFSYEDVGTAEVGHYTYRFVGPDTLDGLPTWVVERQPTDSASHYRRQLVWYDEQELRVLRIDYFDRQDARLKTLRLREFHQYDGRFWRPAIMEMVNHRTGSSTVLKWSNYVFSRGVSRHDFEARRFGQRG